MGLFSKIASAVLPAAATALGGPTAGAIASAASSAWSAQQQNADNAAILKQQQDYNTTMSNTSYQRAVVDMRAAGLNPMLAYSQGGASTPSASVIPAVNTADSGISSAMQSKSTSAAVDKMNAETRNLAEQNANLRAQRDNIAANTLEALSKADLNRVSQSAVNASAMASTAHAATMQAALAGVRSDSDWKGSDAYKRMRLLDAMSNTFGNVLGAGTSALGVARGGLSLLRSRNRPGSGGAADTNSARSFSERDINDADFFDITPSTGTAVVPYKPSGVPFAP